LDVISSNRLLSVRKKASSEPKFLIDGEYFLADRHHTHGIGLGGAFRMGILAVE